ncbi:ribbon-helix-helix protein, CopG family [Phytoactinopolyspora limicola]|uniref:ribbon-helix-helix protein, CopG family n=1 Tax=Phytoactinopolyspora limicola TaxID=2715536 RepID=UPI00140DE3CA|nr:ribbon-helix-helix protein, CopG family [Phytoactinopolyspora limicola]
MATNLRLRADAEEAVRGEAARSGRSQQEVIRAAIDRYLGLPDGKEQMSELDRLVATGAVGPPRSPYRRALRRLRLPRGITSADLLDRDDRV